ncbi:hypothetical protein SAMN05216588_12282 [Pseudomonas flavescens]|uniref:RiboL-PSP-HEPN domain-containing protein n=1 Tax=Phytopseudomonas flavescens TaxID=29435 RepID=A0A1G8MSX2_9GAMM|nr:HEPN domain-containing protein [Pseudomonas flavescens]SDI70953.1 hypothetical protein SAMN05216588_12282 [Pseudomonas flavescens]
MPYVRSIALATLAEEYSVVLGRVKGTKRKELAPEEVEYILGAAIFLAHAALENYVSDLFSSVAKGIRSVAKKGDQLPDELRAHLFLHKLNKSKIVGMQVGFNAENDAFKDVINSLNGHAGTLVDGSRELYSLQGVDIYTTYKYPSKENLNKVFKRVGIENLFKCLDKAMRRNSETALVSLGSLRSGLAHTGKMPGVTSGDVIKRIKDVQDLVRAIDRLLYKHMCSKFGQDSWVGNVSSFYKQT